jgi:hypothetical protein
MAALSAPGPLLLRQVVSGGILMGKDPPHHRSIRPVVLAELIPRHHHRRLPGRFRHGCTPHTRSRRNARSLRAVGVDPPPLQRCCPVFDSPPASSRNGTAGTLLAAAGHRRRSHFPGFRTRIYLGWALVACSHGCLLPCGRPPPIFERGKLPPYEASFMGVVSILR